MSFNEEWTCSIMLKCYRIKEWDTYYENNRTRDLKNMSWVPIPNKLAGDGYTWMIEQKNGAALYGAWIACVHLASTCDPRGTLLRHSNEPHDINSISRITRISESILKEMLDFTVSKCKWMEIIDLGGGTVISHNGAAKPQDAALNRTEQKEQNRTEYKEVYDYYLTLPLMKHKQYTQSMRDSIKRFMDKTKSSLKDCKLFLDRHVIAVESTKNNETPIRKRGITEFFGQKVYNGTELIAEQYMDGGKFFNIKLVKNNRTPGISVDELRKLNEQ